MRITKIWTCNQVTTRYFVLTIGFESSFLVLFCLRKGPGDFAWFPLIHRIKQITISPPPSISGGSRGRQGRVLPLRANFFIFM